jgi:hypothetical protein
MGRPSSYTPELADEIAKRCVMKSLNAVCKADDMPAASTVYAWLIEHKEFSDKYARAREARAFRRAESVDGLMAKVRRGAIEPQAGRLLLDAIKWQTGKENGRVFGDRQVLAGDPEAPLQHEHAGALTITPSDAYLKLLNGG